ncbi:MAG: hypothetical protein HY318_03360, partial [Armatimonadetes bacterium]|nr:hypothetical protein [Armatimonadota bacterium]
MEFITLESATDRLSFDAATGRLLALRPNHAQEVELLASAPEHPVFTLQYLTENSEYRQVDSHSATEVDVSCEASGEGQLLSIACSGVGEMDLDVKLTVRASKQERFSRWSCSVRNGAGVQIVDVQFPYIIVPTEGAVVLPAGHAGHLIHGEALRNLPPDEPRRWQLIPENGNSPHYPGRVFAQFLAAYNDRAGVYLACEDTEGNVKLIHAVRREPGVRLGIAHVGDWPAKGERALEYEVVLGSFTGDWYDAADLYRDWSLQQKWAT